MIKKIGKEIKVNFGTELNCEINCIAEVITKSSFQKSNVAISLLSR